jgi:hypothetical protein
MHRRHRGIGRGNFHGLSAHIAPQSDDQRHHEGNRQRSEEDREEREAAHDVRWI